MKNLFRLPLLVASLGLIADCLHAATFTVTTTNISGPGSLPVAIAQANATPGKNKIQISVTNVITLGVPLPTITNSVTITGATNGSTVISGGGTLPLFTFAAGTTNSLSNLVLANGYTTNSGAAISNSSMLFVSSCIITNNNATNGQNNGGAIINISGGVMAISSSIFSGNRARRGGAVYNSGTMTLSNSQLSDNQAWYGGAIFNGGSLAISFLAVSNNLASVNADCQGGGLFNTGALTISKSTFVKNTVSGSSVEGGAIFSSSGTVGITNSTFYQNAAIAGYLYARGGALYLEANAYYTLVNCTVVSNSSSSSGQLAPWGIAGGICNYSGTFSILNTVIAANSANGSSPDLYGAFVSSGVNLIGNNQGATNLSIFDFQNVSANLGPLQNNGGSTLTCAPLSGSYAIGYGSSTGAPTTDQRGVPRPQGGAFDIGAVQVVTGSPFVAGGAMVSGSGFNLATIFDATNSYRVQASTNLTTWVNLITNSSGGILNFTDTAATNLNCRFYRTAIP